MSNQLRQCFPNGCCGFCAPPVVQKQIENVVHLEKQIVKKEIALGYAVLHAGVQTQNAKYTSPLVTLYLQRHSAKKQQVKRSERDVLVGQKSISKTNHDQNQAKEVDISETEIDMMIIPVEDIIQISFHSDVKKNETADSESTNVREEDFTHNCFDDCGDWVCGTCCSCLAKARVAPVRENTTLIINRDPNKHEDIVDEPLPIPEDDSCTKCCDLVRCWCCRRKKLTKLVRRTFTRKARAASRILTVDIEYSEYSHLETPSNVQLLSQEESLKFFKQKFNPNKTVQFYLVNTTHLDSNHFDAKTKEAELLCRTVMHLKGLKDHYPSENELDKMLQQVSRRTFGDPFNDTASTQPTSTKEVKVPKREVATVPTSESRPRASAEDNED